MEKFIKNLKEWNESGLDFDKYAKPPCRITKALADDICYYTSTLNDFDNGIKQPSEPQDTDDQGNYTYTTFVEKDNKFYFVGYFNSCEDFDISHVINLTKDIL